jgi:hypothetical protein
MARLFLLTPQSDVAALSVKLKAKSLDDFRRYLAAACRAHFRRLRPRFDFVAVNAKNVVASAIRFPIKSIRSIEQNLLRPSRSILPLRSAVKYIDHLCSTGPVWIRDDHDRMLANWSRKIKTSDIPLPPGHRGKSSGTSVEQPF